MTEAQKLKYVEIIQEIRQRIGGCFGTEDGLFARHPADEKMAKEIRALASKNNISLNEIQELTLGFLYRKNYAADHIKTETGNATKFFQKKLKNV